MSKSSIVKGSFGSSTKKISLTGEVVLPLPSEEYIVTLGAQLIECLKATLVNVSPEQVALINAAFDPAEEDFETDEDLTSGAEEDLSVQPLESPPLVRTSAVAMEEEEKTA